MSSNRKGIVIWKNCKIEWEYQSISPNDFTFNPHFKITASDQKGNSVTWPAVTINTDELADSLKGITDFTKLPKPLMEGILDNCVNKLNEDETGGPELTRIEVHKRNFGG